MLGEDDPTRADPPTVNELFSHIRQNYFRLYLNFMYFNIGRIVYLQTDVIFPYVLLAPTIVAGKITLGAMNQILNAFTQVRTSFQYLVNAWSTIVELISIYQRLRAFEAKIARRAAAVDRGPDGADGVVTVARAEPGITASTSSRRPAPARVRRRWLDLHAAIDRSIGADRRCRQLRAAGCVAVQLQSQPAPGAFVPVRGDAIIVVEFRARASRRSKRKHQQPTHQIMPRIDAVELVRHSDHAAAGCEQRNAAERRVEGDVGAAANHSLE